MRKIPVCKLNFRRRLGGSLKKDNGQSLIIVVLAMTAILSMLALTIDGGMAYALHSRMQTAADTAALSGARELALGHNSTAAINRANQILVANGGDLARSTVSVSGGGQVNVTATTLFDTIFGGIVGINQMNISASSAAAWGGITATGSVMPLAVPESWWSPGTVWPLYDSDAGIGPGNWGWVNWGSRGNAKNNVIPPLSDVQISIGDWVESEPGNNTSATQAVGDYWVGQTVTMFLYDITNGEPGRNMQYHVSGFAQFLITEVKATGNPKYILGEFVDYVQLGGVIDPSIQTGNLGVALVAPSDGGGGGISVTSTPVTTTPAATATNTPVPSTATNTPVPAVTNTNVPTATNTPVPPTATRTPVPPTATRTPTPINTNTPTATPTHEPVCVKWHPVTGDCKEWE